VVGYVVLGALLFEFLEAGYELEKRGHIQRYREDCVRELWHITGKVTLSKYWLISGYTCLSKYGSIQVRLFQVTVVRYK
jgi:hypothetical protein